MKCKDVIENCVREHEIQKLIILDGYHSYYDGDFKEFYEECYPDMAELRNRLLEREVATKVMFKQQLIVYLMAERKKK